MALGILIKMFLVGTIYSMIFFINKIFFNSCNLFGAVEKINKWTHGQHFHIIPNIKNSTTIKYFNYRQN